MHKPPRSVTPPLIKNHTPGWLWALIILIVLGGLIYALPNVFGDSPSIQISSQNGNPVTIALVDQVTETLDNAKVAYTGVNEDGTNLTIGFPNIDAQMAANTALQQFFGDADSYVIALNLTPNTPKWLSIFGASPMKLGLDLRGGMYFLLNVDMQEVVNTHLQNEATSLVNDLQGANIRASAINFVPGTGIVLNFNDAASLTSAQSYIESHYSDLTLVADNKALTLTANMTDATANALRVTASDQTLQVMRNRINELGVSEASVAKEGDNRIVIELPGVQDATRAKAIIGGTSTLKLMLGNDTVNAAQVVASGQIPPGSSVYYDANGNPYVLYNPVIISGSAISNASVGYDQQTGAPVVNVSLTGPDVSYFSQVTGQNKGHPMAIVLVQSTFDQEMVNGSLQNVTHTTQTLINEATINSQLGSNFQISGIGNARTAQNLALSIRAGALPAPVQIVEQKQVGPSLGIQNIKMGGISVAIALLAVIVFIAFYYSVFGLIADFTLLLNLVFIVAIMSLIPGATLTLPGIAGIVLNVGLAIDSNVLIFERIREEIRKGTSNMLAIHTGYARAFSTIIDANVTTFMVALILFAIGTGAVKGFAVTLMIGIVTSVFSATVVGRAIVNFVYGRHPNKKLSIGI